MPSPGEPTGPAPLPTQAGTPPQAPTPMQAPLPTPAPTPAERERAVELLTRHYAADRLTETERQARLDRVYGAVTPAELQGVLGDLPAEPELGADLPVKRVRALFSGQEQKLAGVLPRHMQLKARFGYVELDLTGATLQEGVTEIDVRVFCGYAEIRLPAGVRVESVGQALLGYIAIKGAGTAADEHATRAVRVTGRVLCGYTECFRKAERELDPGEAMKQLEAWRR